MNFQENGLALLAIVYSISSLVRLYFYAPQIRSVLRSRDASAIHVPTWVVWTCHNVISSAYGWYVTKDSQFALFFLASAGCTSLIAMVASRKQANFKRAVLTSNTNTSNTEK